MHAILLDACVLFPNYLRDTFLTLAEQELFRPVWSTAILDEVRRNVLAKRQVDQRAFDRTLVLMNTAFPAASVQGWERLIPDLDLPDKDDRHVLAAAIAGGARSVVTFNLSDFPAERLRSHRIEATHPAGPAAAGVSPSPAGPGRWLLRPGRRRAGPGRSRSRGRSRPGPRCGGHLGQRRPGAAHEQQVRSLRVVVPPAQRVHQVS